MALIERHTIELTIEVDQINNDAHPKDWYWNGVMDNATQLLKKERNVNVLSARIVQQFPEMD